MIEAWELMISTPSYSGYTLAVSQSKGTLETMVFQAALCPECVRVVAGVGVGWVLTVVPGTCIQPHVSFAFFSPARHSIRLPWASYGP